MPTIKNIYTLKVKSNDWQLLRPYCISVQTEMAKEVETLELPPGRPHLSVGSTANSGPNLSVPEKPIFQNRCTNYVHHAHLSHRRHIGLHIRYF